MITGAGSGIGRGIAQFLAEKGHHIVVSDLDLSSAKDCAKSITETSGSAKAYELDVTSEASVNQFIDGLDVNIHCLINNAGIQHVEPLDTFPMEKWNLLIQVMLVGVARLTQACLPQMKTGGYGRIINIGSLHSLVASPFKSAYISAKHGLIGFSKTLSLELKDQNITANTLCPAYVKTPLVEKQIKAQAKEHGISEEQVIHDIMLKPMPKKSFIEIKELAGACEFLMSEYAKNITAQAIALDGGWTAQ